MYLCPQAPDLVDKCVHYLFLSSLFGCRVLVVPVPSAGLFERAAYRPCLEHARVPAVEVELREHVGHRGGGLSFSDSHDLGDLGGGAPLGCQDDDAPFVAGDEADESGEPISFVWSGVFHAALPCCWPSHPA